MKFNASEALIANGYKLKQDTLGNDILVKVYERNANVAFYRDMSDTFAVYIALSRDHERLSVYYYDGGNNLIKRRVHMNDKRAFNAIKATVENRNFNW